MLRPLAHVIGLALLSACDGAAAPSGQSSGDGGPAAAGSGAAGASSSSGAGGMDAGPTCEPPATVSAEAWPEADALFHQSKLWIGSDAAFSIDLGEDRSLWLFGDTFVDPSGNGQRSGAAFPRNTIGIQTGRDPSKASIEFYWGSSGGKPSSFFPEDGDHWFWPQHGVRLPDRLLVFASEIQSARGGLGFEAVGGAAFSIDNPDAPPSSWHVTRLAPPPHAFGAILGSAALVQGESLYAAALHEPGDHDAYLARWPLAAVATGDLSAPEWWSGAGWEAAPASGPAPLWKAGAPEFSVSVHCGVFVEVESVGFGATQIGVRRASALTGAWSDDVLVFTPPESAKPNAFVYAGKGHPELAGADLVVTYASNSFDSATLVADQTLYYPRFVRLTFAK